jgi:hypothetical protein
LQESLDVATSKTLYSPDRMAGQFAPINHPVDRHRRQLQQFCELSDGVELGLGIVP